MLDVVRARVLPAIQRHGPIRSWIIDDTGFPKKGRHSVGVARQSCGPLGKQDNGQVAVTLAVATGQASRPIAHRLYLPEAGAGDPARRAKVGVPDGVTFRTKPRIALAQTRRAVERGVPTGGGAGGRRLRQRHGLPDRPHGAQPALRRRHAGLDPPLAPGGGPLPPKPWSGAVGGRQG